MSKIENLQRMFRILPVLTERKSISIAELIELGGYSKRKELINDIEALTMLGTPPYSPADLFDIEIQADTITLHSEPQLSKPLSLTPKEWILLRSMIDEDRKMANSAEFTESQVLKLTESLSTVSVHFIEADPEAEFRSKIEQALNQDRCIEIKYSNSFGPEEASRQVEPWYLLEYNRSRYLLAFDQSKQEPRVFRIDRIIQLKQLAQKRSRPVPSDVASIRSQSLPTNQILIRFQVDRSVLAALQREFKFEIETESTDAVVGKLFTQSLEFFRWYLKTYTPFITVLEPIELRQWILDQAKNFPIPDLFI